MCELQHLGQYIGRPVKLLNIQESEYLCPNSLKFSTTCLWLGETQDVQSRAKLAERMIRANPLTLCIGGCMPEQLFSEVLERLNARSQTIMTSFTSPNDVEDFLETFFYSSFPSEDRHEDWLEYRVVTYRVHDQEIHNAFTEFVRALRTT